MPKDKFDLNRLRRIAITAIFSDDLLMDCLVLKGGNALDLVYGVTSRTSIDLDFSMQGDFENSSEARDRLFTALRDRFDAVGYVLFDEKFTKQPQLKGVDEKPWWGGYESSFKLIERDKYRSLKDRLDKLRMNAIPIDSDERRSFKIDLSKYEFTDGKVKHEIDNFEIFAYTPTMIVVEKIRAICQQMPEYPHTGNKKARARDFYDAYQVLTTLNIDLNTEENQILTRHIFGAKRVPLSLLGKIVRQREFHRPDWQSVVDATTGNLLAFDFYFEFIIKKVEELKPLWME